MPQRVNLVEPAAAIDWDRLRREGDAYLRRLGLPEEIAVYAVAKLYVLNWKKWRSGRKWQPKRKRWETDATIERLSPKVFRPDGTPFLNSIGRPIPPSMTPKICEGCGDYCSFNADRCRACWEKIRPRKSIQQLEEIARLGT